MQVVTVPIDSIQPDPNNARRHSKLNIAAIKDSLARFGQQKPIVIDQENIIRAGSGTYEALKSLGADVIDVVVSKLQGSEMTAYAIADNHAGDLATWDDDILRDQLSAMDSQLAEIVFHGFDDFNIPEGDHTQKDDRLPDRGDDRTNIKCVSLGDIWVLGDHRLLCWDATDIPMVAALLNGITPELMFTSPPYADMRDYKADGLDLDPDYLARVLDIPCGLYAINLGIKRKKSCVIPYWDHYINHAAESGLKLLSWNVWDKGNAGSVSANTALFPIKHEWILVFGKDKPRVRKTHETKDHGRHKDGEVREPDGTTTKRKKYTVGKYKKMGTVLQCQAATDHADKHGNHPARFPVQIPQEYIEATVSKSGFVLDPFLGSGSTMIACEKTGRSCLGLEISPEYMSEAIERWEDFTGNKAVKIDTLGK